MEKDKRDLSGRIKGDFMRKTAVLIDTVSIQKYIFSSNRLKENLGASQLVKDIYDEQIKLAIEDIFGREIKGKQFDDWKEYPEEMKLKNENTEFEVGYIGGGKALLFFKKEDKAREFVRNWTKKLVIETPGLQTATAISYFDLDDFKDELTKLFSQLSQNKNRFFPNVTLSKYGITADCPLSGLSADIHYHDVDMDKYISSVSNARLEAAETAQEKIRKEYADILKNKYIFTNQIDHLGQTTGESHIAIVHIDSNQMGKRVMSCKNLQELRELSKFVKETTENSFRELISYIVDNMDDFFLDKSNGFEIPKIKISGKYVLPIRPIIIGGDDITFVCDGRLGVHFAEKFIEFFSKKQVNVNDGKPLSACAGVSIIKTKYPFYRGYLLVEELCNKAKKESRREQNSSFLDSHIAYGGFSGTLLDIREKHYKVKEGTLHFGPYRLSNNKPDDEKNIVNLKKGIRYLVYDDKTRWPRSKLKEMRSVLTLGKETTKLFIKEMKARGLELPDVKGGTDYTNNGWENSKTPYFDMIELMEMYPEYFLNEDKNEGI